MGISANTIIYTGGAHSSYGNETPGDQRQDSGSQGDMKGEVSLRQEANETAFKSAYSAYKIYRPKDPNVAQIMASLMITACNNPNVGYSQSGAGGASGRTAIFTYGAESSTPINCDCSSLVSYCIQTASGVTFSSTTASMVGSGPGSLSGTGLFMDPVAVLDITYASNPPYNGDVLCKNGHVELVVSGNPRDGAEDEIISGTWSGDGVEISSYRNANIQIEYSFTPRTTEPSPDEEGYQYYNQSYGSTKNGSYAWGRFSEICKSKCDLSRGMPRKWYLYTEDKYGRGAAPSLGAVMCYTNVVDSSSPGLVSIVEKISSSYIYVSQGSVKKNGKFEYVRRTKDNGSWDLDLDKDGVAEYVFQGFIYNPTVDTTGGASILDTFIKNATKNEGDSGKYVKKLTGVDPKQAAWSGAYIHAVAIDTGNMIETLIPATNSCSAIGSTGVRKNMGSWIDGPALGGNPSVQVGDIALFRTKAVDTKNKYYADKAGIVVSVGLNNAEVDATNKSVKYSFKVMMGDSNGQVKKKSYTTLSKTLSGIYRPNWEKVDGTADIVKQVSSGMAMYTEGTNIEDAAIRDTSYLTAKGKPSIKETGITACAINYTGLLADMYSVLVEAVSSNSSNPNLITNIWSKTQLSNFELAYVEPVVMSQSSMSALNVDSIESSISGTNTVMSEAILSQDGNSIQVLNPDTGKYETMTLNASARTLFNALYTQFRNNASCVAAMANMWQESRWTLSAKSSDGGYGYIQWTDTGTSLRATWMREYCRNHGNHNEWDNNASGQIEYLFYEASQNSHYQEGLDKVKSVPDTQKGAIEAAGIFWRYIEGGKNQWGTAKEAKEVPKRAAWARDIWTLFMGEKK